ncbi:uncharacterized protein MYCGRDRAFT_94942 [Zymoseptoria tritici IPO323]|uniref:Uncharacterized protein n=1 Tax=Zymoseptoria tritici (strain CBS 115943 / IPO323) TaxID=336722 RepID=F9XI62_ZYMTI|nr:uncharacterized protein MYCGRDRAFT_94942 [Zymoseptoria tritici IPO323]EGP85484.1 hypothetical protein MYCGRDRAFT_94942 [Zymoseptoria tritici IPO323]
MSAAHRIVARTNGLAARRFLSTTSTSRISTSSLGLSRQPTSLLGIPRQPTTRHGPLTRSAFGRQHFVREHLSRQLIHKRGYTSGDIGDLIGGIVKLSQYKFMRRVAGVLVLATACVLGGSFLVAHQIMARVKEIPARLHAAWRRRLAAVSARCTSVFSAFSSRAKDGWGKLKSYGSRAKASRGSTGGTGDGVLGANGKTENGKAGEGGSADEKGAWRKGWLNKKGADKKAVGKKLVDGAKGLAEKKR